MKKRMLSALLALCMMLTMVPAAFAAEEDSSDNSDVSAQAATELPAADKNGVITLTGDVTLASTAWQNLFTDTNNITIDLAEHKITMSDAGTVSVPEGKSLKLQNGKISAMEYNDGTKAVFSAAKDATIIMDEITMETDGAALFPAGNAAAVTVTNSNITAGTYVVGTNASLNDGELVYSANVKITLQYSTLEGTGYRNNDKDTCTVMINVPGTLDIDRCTITGHRQAVLVRGGTADISNSTIQLTDAYTGSDAQNYENGNWSSGNNLPMAALVVGNRSSAYEYPATCTLTDTTVTAVNGYRATYVYAMDTDTRAATLNIAGESSVISDTDMSIVANETADVEITGGTFSSDVSEYVPANYKCVKNDNDGTYTVSAMDGELAVDASVDKNNTVTATLEGTFKAGITKDVADDTSDGTENGSGVENNAITLQLTTSDSGKTATTTTLNITSTTAGSLGDAESLTVKTDVGTVSLDSAALDKIAQRAKVDTENNAVKVAVTKNETQSDNTVLASYTVEVKIGDSNVLPYGGSDNGTVTITVPLPDESKTAPDYKVWYVTREPSNTIHYVNELNQVGADTGYIAYQIGHLSETVVTAIDASITTDEAIVTGSDGNLKGSYSTLAAAVAAAADGDTITLLKSVELTSGTNTGDSGSSTSYDNYALLKIESKNITIQNAEGNNFTLTLNYKAAEATSTTKQAGAIHIGDNAGLTLKNVAVMIKGSEADQGGTLGKAKVGSGFRLHAGSKLVLDNAAVTLDGLSRGVNNGGGTGNSVTLDNGSTLTIRNLSGNASNGGDWTVKNGSKVTVNGCDLGLSVKNLTVNDSTITVENAKKFGIIITDNSGAVDIKGSSTVTVTNCATDEKDGRAAVELAPNSSTSGTLTVDSNSMLNVSGTGDRSNLISLPKNASTEFGGVVTGTIQAGDNTKSTIYRIAFDVTPRAAEVVVTGKNNSVEVKHVGNVFALAAGDYTYTVSCSGYQTATGSFTVSKDDTIEVTLRSNSSSGGGGSSTPSYTITAPTNVTGGSISVSPSHASYNSTVTITVDPDEGYELDTLTVTDEDGNRISLTNAGNGKYTFKMPRGKVTINATFAEVEDMPETPDQIGSFADVRTNDWFADAVQYMLDNGMMNGTSDTTFSPNATTTRAMIVTILHRLDNDPSASASGFTDIAAGSYYVNAVNWAAANDIVNGISETSFAPNTAITREQMAAILYRYAQFKGYDTTIGGMALNEYADASQISSYATTAMQWANENGLITGRTSTTLVPQGTATRAEVATILMRFCENIAK